MLTAYVFDNSSLYQVNRVNDSLECHSVDSPIEQGAIVACFAPGEFYFINQDSPNILRRYVNSLLSTNYELPGPSFRILVHRQKVFCCGDDSIYIFDPLSSEVENIKLCHKVLDMEVADHGFVFVNNLHELYAFNFNNGIKRVMTQGKSARLLGHRNRCAVALIGSSKIISVNENAEILDNIFHFSLTTRFISLDRDQVLTCLERGKLCLYSRDAIQYIHLFRGQDLQLLSVPTIQSEDLCLICLCDFEDEPGVTLDCGHRFHRDCVAEFSSRADSFVKKGEHITFTYAVCPGGCGFLIRHPAAPLSAYVGSLYQFINKDAEQRLREMPGKTSEDLLYYICFSCGKPFYGGERWCFRSMSGEPSKMPNELICSDCNKDLICPNHQHKFILYKCRYCCNPATHLSFGNRYMCERCNHRWENSEPEPIACPGPIECPLENSHTTKGSYPLGCMLCMPLNLLGSKLFSLP